jgi:hypothetical protein
MFTKKISIRLQWAMMGMGARQATMDMGALVNAGADEAT